MKSLPFKLMNLVQYENVPYQSYRNESYRKASYLRKNHRSKYLHVTRVSAAGSLAPEDPNMTFTIL